MRVLRIICLAAVFTSILAIPQKNKNHQIENSKTIQDVEREANKTEIPRRLFDSPDEKDEKFYFLQTRHRRNNRIKSNAKSSTLTKEESDEQSTLVSMSDSPKKIDSSDTNFMDIDIIMRNRTSRSENTDIYTAEFSEIEQDDSFNSLLTRLFEALQNDSAKDDRDILNGSNSINNSSDDEDRCQKWLNNRERIEQAFPGSIEELPACPCQYPNDIFYNDMIWDKNRRKKFRWRDATNDPQRSVYKKCASYCVRSLASPGTKTMGGQHCCYDENRKLLTRGSGAGTPYIVNPEVSFVLHDKVDLLPWRLCKGDFTRYNKVRVPNNENNCEVNPDDEEYEYEVENAKNY